MIDWLMRFDSVKNERGLVISSSFFVTEPLLFLSDSINVLFGLEKQNVKRDSVALISLHRYTCE